MHNNMYVSELKNRFYYYSTPQEREKGLEALRRCLVRDGWIKENTKKKSKKKK